MTAPVSLLEVGARVGHLTVRRDAGTYTTFSGDTYRQVLVCCDCGVTFPAIRDLVELGRTISCGCVRRTPAGLAVEKVPTTPVHVQSFRGTVLDMESTPRTTPTDAELYAENVRERQSAWDRFLDAQARGETR